ncbi:uncharacterized protein EI90DRAFT_3129605 [Cantharellus anzutake]|uniref:uncharacterized protein n=1 Tax=Cantharellus anzutake TaxID=1750568 RepID=UPI001905CE0A|nr:uncharacterized protein EI90DRAFT_3129605 [Cantharellus anzutake]KAF8324671.1 hypothetical protein EI90DRAFT_3129605 [Cantharellus anzutake]
MGPATDLETNNIDKGSKCHHVSIGRINPPAIVSLSPSPPTPASRLSPGDTCFDPIRIETSDSSTPVDHPSRPTSPLSKIPLEECMTHSEGPKSSSGSVTSSRPSGRPPLNHFPLPNPIPSRHGTTPSHGVPLTSAASRASDNDFVKSANSTVRRPMRPGAAVSLPPHWLRWEPPSAKCGDTTGHIAEQGQSIHSGLAKIAVAREPTRPLVTIGYRASPLNEGGHVAAPSQSVGMLSSSIPARWPVVPLGHWYRLVVDEVQDPELLWLEKCSAQGVYAAHRARKNGCREPPSMELLFKRLADRDGMADKLRSEGRACSSDMYVGSLLNYTSTVDLLYVDMAFTRKHADIPAIIGTAPPKANKANHLHTFLQYEKYPPLVPQSPAWLQSRVYQEASDTELHRFEVLIGAHSLQSQGLLKFSMPMWPTSGPMDGVIHRVARWAHEEMTRNAEEPRIIESSVEMLQYHPKGNNWQIVLELNLGRPRYMKHVSEPWTHLI